MSLLRRRMSYGRLKYAEFSLSGFVPGPSTAPCNGIGVLGKKSIGSIGSISPGTFRGYTISDLDAETTYADDGSGFCIIYDETTYFTLTGTGASSLPGNFIDRIEFLSTGFSLIAADATFSGGGNWTWVNSGGQLGTGTVRIWYKG